MSQLFEQQEIHPYLTGWSTDTNTQSVVKFQLPNCEDLLLLFNLYYSRLNVLSFMIEWIKDATEKENDKDNTISQENIGTIND